MPTGSERPAAAAAAAEAAGWAELASAWAPERQPALWADLPPVEPAVMPDAEPGDDLHRRAQRWGLSLTSDALGDVAAFAAGLARAEAEAWERDDAPVATQAYTERRLLAADRILPWAIPWLDAAGRCYPEARDVAHGSCAWLLELGERLRPAPLLAGDEGLTLPGHDGYGPRDFGDRRRRLRSLWGGAVLFRRTVESLLGGRFADREAALDALPVDDDDRLWHLYTVAAARWRRVGEGHPGTAHYWRDLAHRADRTAALFGGD